MLALSGAGRRKEFKVKIATGPRALTPPATFGAVLAFKFPWRRINLPAMPILASPGVASPVLNPGTLEAENQLSTIPLRKSEPMLL